jgi:hypothetical protein
MATKTDKTEKLVKGVRVWNKEAVRMLRGNPIWDDIKSYMDLFNVTNVYALRKVNDVLRRIRPSNVDAARKDYKELLRLVKGGCLDFEVLYALCNDRWDKERIAEHFSKYEDVVWDKIEAESSNIGDDGLLIVITVEEEEEEAPVTIDPVHARYIDDARWALRRYIFGTPEFNSWYETWAKEAKDSGVKSPHGYVRVAQTILSYDPTKDKSGKKKE